MNGLILIIYHKYLCYTQLTQGVSTWESRPIVARSQAPSALIIYFQGFFLYI